MRFPSKKKIQEMADKLENVEGSQPLPENATLSEKTKYKICEKFVKYCLENRITQKELADQLEISPARVNEIVKYKIEKFTIDRLLEYYEKLFPKKAAQFLKAVV